MSRFTVAITRSRMADEPLVQALVGSIVLGLVVVALAFIGRSVVNETFAAIFVIYVIAVVGLGIFMGNSGVLSFGHAGFMAIGAYASGLASMEPTMRRSVLPRFPELANAFTTSFASGAVIALAMAGILAAGFGLAISRLPRYAAGIATLGILIIVQTTLLAADEITNGASPLYGVSREVGWWTILGVALVVIAIGRVYRGSRAGLQLRSSREDEMAARAAGVNVGARRLQAWVLSAVIAAAAGVLLGHYLGAFAPNQFYLTLTVSLVAMLIVGGAATVSGAVIGAALVTVTLELLSRIENGADLGPIALPAIIGLPTLGLSVVFIVVVYFRRDGLFGRFELDEAVLRLFARTAISGRVSSAGEPRDEEHPLTAGSGGMHARESRDDAGERDGGAG